MRKKEGHIRIWYMSWILTDGWDRSKWENSISSGGNTINRTERAMDGARLAKEQVHVRQGEKVLGKWAGLFCEEIKYQTKES